MAAERKDRGFLERDARAKVAELSQHFPCVLVTGARQVGKSTLLQQMMPQGMRYLTLDDFQLAEFARQDPVGFLDAYPAPLCIDEVQYAPELFRAIKMKVDADLARDAGVSPKTAAAWVSILEASGIVELLPPYHVNTTKRLSKTPKLYFTDTGLCCWLAGWHQAEQLMNSSAAGAVLETWVYGQLIRRYAQDGKRPELSYYRDLDGAEVDFVIEQDGGVFPMEVKRTSTPSVSDLRWCGKIPVAPWAKLMPPVLFCTAQEARPMPHGAFAFPVSGL